MARWHCKTGARSHQFDSLGELMAKATPRRSGDELAGMAATNAEERAAAQICLAEVPLRQFLDEPLVPPEIDEVSRLILAQHDEAAFAEVAGLDVGQFREWLLRYETDSSALTRIGPGLTPEMAAAAGKFMSNQDLILAAKNAGWSRRSATRLGCRGRFGGWGDPRQDRRHRSRHRWRERGGLRGRQSDDSPGPVSTGTREKRPVRPAYGVIRGGGRGGVERARPPVGLPFAGPGSVAATRRSRSGPFFCARVVDARPGGAGRTAESGARVRGRIHDVQVQRIAELPRRRDRPVGKRHRRRGGFRHGRPERIALRGRPLEERRERAEVGFRPSPSRSRTRTRRATPVAPWPKSAR